MRTQEEIVERCRAKSAEFLSFEPEVLLDYLDYAHAKEFLEPEVTEEQWAGLDHGAGGNAPSHKRILVESDIPEQMAGYMSFAWGKVEDHRGISAGRSIEKLKALAWLLGDDETVTFAEDSSNYPQYGAPILKCLCQRYDLPIPEGEGLRRMAEGLPCVDGCEEGCGR